MLVWYSNNTFQVKDISIQRTNAIVPSRPLDGESTVYTYMHIYVHIVCVCMYVYCVRMHSLLCKHIRIVCVRVRTSSILRINIMKPNTPHTLFSTY